MMVLFLVSSNGWACLEDGEYICENQYMDRSFKVDRVSIQSGTDEHGVTTLQFQFVGTEGVFREGRWWPSRPFEQTRSHRVGDFTATTPLRDGRSLTRRHVVSCWETGDRKDFEAKSLNPQDLTDQIVTAAYLQSKTLRINWGRGNFNNGYSILCARE